MIEQEFILKLKEKFPKEKYEILKIGGALKDKSTFKCLKCGRIFEVQNQYLFSSGKKALCSKCNYKRKDTAINEEKIRERLSGKAHEIEFQMEERNGIRHNTVSFVCNFCGRRNKKEVANFLRQKYNCGFCEGRKENKDTQLFIEELKQKHGDHFLLLSPYVNAVTPVLIKCAECGFIRKVKPSAILSSGYCPRCGKKQSRGEKKILSFLEKNHISYETQKYFSDWNIGLHYFDFYLPDYNCVLEYHGPQHYERNSFFNKTEEEFLYRKEKDRQKKEGAVEHKLNYVSIKYILFDSLEEVLSKLFDSTTIPLGSKGKCLEIETLQDIG